MRIDYSQYGQALLLSQLLGGDIPRIVVDIGANDGICGSNSRALIESGWKALLVEPLPKVFERLKQSSGGLMNVELRRAACSDRVGSAQIYMGRDGELGQMSSLSRDPALFENLSKTAIEVETVTLPNLIAEYNIPPDFGVLLIDTEGWDLTVLEPIRNTPIRPRVIVTEDFVSTNDAKYALLNSLGYQNVAIWASDSFWSYGNGTNRAPLMPPVDRVPEGWKPTGRRGEKGNCMQDQAASYQKSIAGWAWTGEDLPPEKTDVIVMLRSLETDNEAFFRAWRTPRPDVADVFESPDLLYSGFRSQVDVAKGEYVLTILQQGDDFYTQNTIGSIVL